MADNTALRLVGKTIGGCRITRLLGTGGMGAVYLANQESLGKEVAIKILDERWASRKEHVEGFLREARLAAKLEDEHIVQIYDVGTDGQFHYIVMQYAKGENLKDRLRRAPVGVEEALSYIEGVARGLSIAHRHGIVHRDIKPGNLVIGDDGIIKILDFGLARAEEAESDKSQGQFMGSVAYMAPEQSEYMPVEARTDLYSLGVTAYHCFAGTLPFRGENNFDLIVKHHCEEPAAPTLVRNDVPLTLSRVILRMMAKDPAERYGSIEDVLVDLKLIRRHQLPATPSPWQRRPLNPRGLNLAGLDSQQMYRDGLKVQREQFTAGKPVTPLRELFKDTGLKTREGGDPEMVPVDYLELKCGERRLSLADAAKNGLQAEGCSALEFAGRFTVAPHEGRVVVRIKGQKPLSIEDVQRLFDLLESIPGDIRQLAVALQPEYSAQGSDIRWVVDTYNILDKRGCAFTLVVGSMENHTTFVNLGIDTHIKLELELGGAISVSLERFKPDEADIDTAELEPVGELTPSARALVTQIREMIAGRELADAARAWRRLITEGIDRKQLDSLRDLRDLLYDKLLADGKEAFDAEDHETATERFNLLIDLDPARHHGHFYKGLLLKSEGKLEYAQAFLTQAILAAPDDAELFYHRAIVRSRVDDLDGALRDLDMALQHNPRMTSAYYNRAKLHKRMGREDLMKRDLLMYDRLKGGSTKLKAASPTPTAERT
jgi:tetratricopeptide (TPR) repeat protein